MHLAGITRNLLQSFAAQRPLRTGSLIITVYGDSIAPRGGSLWIGSLIQLLADFGPNQRLVRTSVSRLANAHWLQSKQLGRRSFYSLSDVGRNRIDEAGKRIYGGPRERWSGSWCMILLTGVDAPARERIRKELTWLGFGAFSTNLLAHPEPDMASVEQHLKELGCAQDVIVIDGRIHDSRPADPLQQLVHSSWQLESLEERYLGFIEHFRPVYQAARRVRSIDSRVAFQLRTLLIHEYRKILLRDPVLPRELLPATWDGAAAYQLCRNIYALVFEAADRYLTEHVETLGGALPPPDPPFYERFGGLK